MQVIKLNKNTNKHVFEQIAHLHEQLLSVGVLSSLGTEFLAKLYRTLASDRDSAVYVALEDGEILAFVSCSSNTGKFYKRFISNNLFTMCILMPKIFTSKLLKRVFSITRYLFKKNYTIKCDAELLSIGVIDDAQRLGLGSILFDKVYEFMNLNKVKLFKVTAAHTQVSAQKFYRQKGGIPNDLVHLGDLLSTIYYFKVN